MAAAPSAAVPPQPPKAAPLDEHEAFVDALRHLSRVLGRAKARRCEAGELSLQQATLLSGLLDADELTVGGLADRAEVAKPTATRMLDALERSGHVRRRHSEADRRVVLVSLTAGGRAALEARWGELQEALERASAALEPGERAEATRLLHRVAELIADI